MDWLDLLAVQGTLKSLLQHHSSKVIWLFLPIQEHGITFKFFETSLIFLMTVLRSPLVAQLVKNPPAMQETLVRFLGQEDLLEKG